MGELAAAIAHEVNQPLAAISHANFSLRQLEAASSSPDITGGDRGNCEDGTRASAVISGFPACGEAVSAEDGPRHQPDRSKRNPLLRKRVDPEPCLPAHRPCSRSATRAGGRGTVTAGLDEPGHERIEALRSSRNGHGGS